MIGLYKNPSGLTSRIKFEPIELHNKVSNYEQGGGQRHLLFKDFAHNLLTDYLVKWKKKRIKYLLVASFEDGTVQESDF